MSFYKVTGRNAYRGHTPGTTFEAHLDPAAERRAIARGSIALVKTAKPKLKRGSYKLPKKPDGDD